MFNLSLTIFIFSLSLIMEVTKTWIHYLIFSLIVVIAFLGNSLVIYVLFSRRKTFLTKPYGVFILNLAIVDFLTAIFLIFR
jgi:hypothetical protein